MPDATCDEIAAHLYNEGGEIYSNQTISKRLKELDITQKIASVEAYQAQAEAVQRHVYAFWNHPPPFGICGIPRRMLINVDEFGVSIERCNRKKGWALKVFPVRKDGHYGHVKRSPSFLPLSQVIQTSPQICMAALSGLGAGFIVSGTSKTDKSKTRH